MGHGGADVSAGELVLGCRREPPADIHAPSHPVALAPQVARYPLGGEPLLGDQRAHHPCLIEGGEGARRCVGNEQQPFVLPRRARLLEDHRDVAAALLAPAGQAFEPVDELIGAVVGGHHADG